MPIEAVLFDLDGTLLDRDASLALFIRDQYGRYPQLHSVPSEEWAQRFIELDNHGYVWKDKVYRQLLDQYAVGGVEWPELLQDYVSGFQRHCRGYPGLLETLTELKGRGMKLALVSNGYGLFQFDNFNALGIGHLFDEVLISEWEGLRKPDPAIFRLALTKLGVEAVDALFVGDHPDNDIRASRAVGLTAIWKRNEGAADSVEADAIIDNLEELLPYVQESDRNAAAFKEDGPGMHSPS